MNIEPLTLGIIGCGLLIFLCVLGVRIAYAAAIVGAFGLAVLTGFGPGLSTVGVVPGMRRLAQESLPVTLAVSLHAPDDRLRNELVPLNRRYPLDEAREAHRALEGRETTGKIVLNP